MKKKIFLLSLFICFIAFNQAIAINNTLNLVHLNKDTSQINTPKKIRTYQTVRTSSSPKINGILDDECWNLGEWQSDFKQYAPLHGHNSNKKTDFKILYDDKFIYAGVRIYDDMKNVSRRYNTRDVFSGDMFGIAIDSYFDHRSAFEFSVSSTGQKADVMFGNDFWDLSWNAVWDVKISSSDSCWIAEYKIPLSQLRYSAKDEQVWGIHIWRWTDRTQEENQWELLPNDGSGVVNSFGEMHGIKGLKKSRRIELSPYSLGKIATNKLDAENPFSKKTLLTGTVGLDAKIGISNNLTLDMTINPDFGQVESDPSEMNLSAFESYLEEKRSFFLEGKNIFNFSFGDDRLFYSRRIGHNPSYKPNSDNAFVKQPENTSILGAFKLSGKTENGLSIGILSSTTRSEYASVYNKISKNNHDELVEPLSHYFVSRFQKDFNKGDIVVGGIYSQANRAIDDKNLYFLTQSSSVLGLDYLQYWKDRKYFIQIKTIGSLVNGKQEAMISLERSSARYFQRLDANYRQYDSSLTTMSGVGASIQIGRNSKGHWRYNTEFLLKTPSLELNDLGYMQVADQIRNTNNIVYVVKEPVSILRNYLFFSSLQNYWYFNGVHQSSSLNIGFEAEFKNNWSINGNMRLNGENYDNYWLRGGQSILLPGNYQFNLRVGSDQSKNVSISANSFYSKAKEGQGFYKYMQFELNFRPFSRLNVSSHFSFAQTYRIVQFIENVKNQSIVSTLDSRDFNLVIRANLILRTNLSLQYYGSPFLSLGKFFDYKKITNSKAEKFENRYQILNNIATDNHYKFDLNGDGKNIYSTDNQDFNFMQFRSNFVVRWEFHSGSSLYLVWAQDRTESKSISNYNIQTAQENLREIFPRNFFLIKLNYWFTS